MKTLKLIVVMLGCFTSCGCAWSRAWDLPSYHLAQAADRWMQIKEAEERGYDIRPYFEDIDRYRLERSTEKLSSTK